MIARGTRNVASTITGPVALGSQWRIAMRAGDAPSATAAVEKSRSRKRAINGYSISSSEASIPTSPHPDLATQSAPSLNEPLRRGQSRKYWSNRSSAYAGRGPARGRSAL